MAYVRNYMENNMGQHAMMDFHKEALRDALELVKKAVSGEKEDEMFYDYLIGMAPTKEEKEIIRSIRDDERKHNTMFRRIYKDFTGRDIPTEDLEEFEKPKSYIEGIKKALFGELKAVETYRKIRQGLPYTLYRDMLFEIITDEIKHGIKYNYILYLNSLPKKYAHCKDNKEHKEHKEHMKKRISEKVNNISTSITEVSGNALNRAKEKFKEENILEEVIIPGIMLGIKNTYLVKNDEEGTRDRVNIKEDVLVNYLGELTEMALKKLKEKVDIEGLVQQYVIPQLIETE
ncbi:ferritin-like domain-containing protein [Clostridium bovifaecis]|uniref:Ferritin-like domain-containing protein n=1 Tax=Clostridium bovifaecis TaxID=2184719 RepID=A0A6I6F3R5_9CLOT|nr:ferritin-like domain-containing protein [Clostridium bovifaecis]